MPATSRKRKKAPRRPTRYTPALAEEICRRVAAGEALAAICAERDMPDRSSVGRWRRADPALDREFARAREEGCEVIAAEALRIADTPMEGETVKTVGERTEITRADMLGHRKLQVETRLRLLARWDPKRYGERVAVEATHDVADPVKELLLSLRRGE